MLLLSYCLVTEELPTKLVGSFGTEMHSSGATNFVSTSLTDAQHDSKAMWRNQRWNGDEYIGEGHCTQHCCLATVWHDRHLVFPTSKLRFPQLSRRPRPRQRLSNGDDPALRNATPKPPNYFGGRLVRVARAVKQATITAVPAVERTQWVYVDSSS